MRPVSVASLPNRSWPESFCALSPMSPRQCRRAVQQVMETFGALDILINCAGVSMSTAAGHSDEARIKFFEADPEGWQRILAINTIGAFLMARFAAEPMIKRGWGRIIHVTTSVDNMLAPVFC